MRAWNVGARALLLLSICYDQSQLALYLWVSLGYAYLKQDLATGQTSNRCLIGVRAEGLNGISQLDEVLAEHQSSTEGSVPVAAPAGHADETLIGDILSVSVDVQSVEVLVGVCVVVKLDDIPSYGPVDIRHSASGEGKCRCLLAGHCCGRGAEFLGD